MQINYRPEIDGLRTIAVLAVIIHHAKISFGNSQLLKGGLVGVDVFFVISGFLITSIILKEYQQTDKFSFTNFYERRARRLLPALFVVILASLPFAWHLLLPHQLVDYSNSILSSLVFGSNIYWHQSLQEYGAESALLKPFLHTWSLAVEEQFYIVYPIILVVLYRWLRTYIIAILIAVLLLSLHFAESTLASNSSFSFYMLPSRFWELLCGGVLANLLFLHPQQKNTASVNRIMPLLGLCLIIYSMIFIDFDSFHPGYITLIPVIGVVLIIWFANEKDLVTKILSTKLFVGIGLISYSLYLWHYPIFSFGRYLNPKPELIEKAVWVFLAFILSMTTYVLIEKPFRSKSIISQKRLTQYLATTFMVAACISLYWTINNGFDSRFGYVNDVLKNAQRIYVSKDGQKCHSGGRGRNPEFQLNESCTFIYGPTTKYIIAVGDSHAGSLSENLRILAKANELNFLQLTNAGCQHVKGVKGINIRTTCARRSRELVDYLKNYPNSIIVYNSRVPLLLEIEKFLGDNGEMEDNYKSVSQKYKNGQLPIRSERLVASLIEQRSVSEKLVIVYPVPEQGFHVSDELFRNHRQAMTREMLPVLTTSYDAFKARVKHSNQTLDKVIGDNVFRVYPERIFCSEESGKCIVSDRDRIYFGTDNHVSPLGSSLIVDQIAKTLGLKVNPF